MKFNKYVLMLMVAGAYNFIFMFVILIRDEGIKQMFENSFNLTIFSIVLGFVFAVIEGLMLMGAYDYFKERFEEKKPNEK